MDVSSADAKLVNETAPAHTVLRIRHCAGRTFTRMHLGTISLTHKLSLIATE